MSTGRIITYIVAAFLILIGLGLAVIIGLSYIVQAGSGGSVVIGLVFLIIGFLMIAGGVYLIYMAGRGKMGAVTENVTLKVDLPANVSLDTLKCKSCGVAGAPVVNCPYCHSTYQLTEEPKW
jgi:hypothetical protein